MAARSPLCLACVRRTTSTVFQPQSSTAEILPFTQTRSKHRLRPRDLGVHVRLLEDVHCYGPKGNVLLVPRGIMRNTFFPRGEAEYLTKQRWAELGLSKNDVKKRLPKFGLEGEEEEERRHETVETIVETATRRERVPVIEAVALNRAHDLLATLLPETLDFRRKPNRTAAEPETPSIPRSPLLAARANISRAANTEDTASAEEAKPPTPVIPAATPIFGSVTTADIAQLAKEMLILDDEAARIPLEGKHIKFLGDDEGSDRLKVLGRKEIEISMVGDLPNIGGGELRPVRKWVDVVADE